MNAALSWLTRQQALRPWWFILTGLVVTVLSTTVALHLRLQTGFEALLPESRPSVQELKRVSSLTKGVSTVFVVLEGGPETPVSALRDAADTLVQSLNELGPPWVGHAESGVHEGLQFLGQRAGLFLSLEQLEALSADLDARHARSVNRATGLGVDLDDDPDPAPFDVTALRASLGEGVDPSRFPGGYYQSADGRALVVFVRSKVPTGDFARGNEALRKIREVVERVDVRRFDPHITVGYAGDLNNSVSEYNAVSRDLLDVGLVGVLLIIGVILLYYLRARMVVLVTVVVAIGVSWTFGLTELTVGQLNIATGFLFTIIAGNGINFAIIYLSRFLEARRTLPLVRSMYLALRDSWAPTLTAGSAAAVAYGALATTQFRGFHDFGLIGGAGMLLCWLATISLLPPMLVVAERVRPGARRATLEGGHFGAPFVYVLERWPGATAAIGALLTVIAVFGTIAWVREDPMDYDLRHLRTDMRSRAEEYRRDTLGNELTGHVGASGMAILVERPEQVEALRSELYARRDAAPEGLKPFKKLHALQDFVPERQREKIPILTHVRERLLRAHAQGAITADQWKQIEPLLPPPTLTPFTMAELPESIADPFTEANGVRGRVVYISPTERRLIDDAKYLFRWADSYRETRLPDGKVILGSGRAVIYADVLSAVVEDVPRTVAWSFGGTTLVVLLAFRGRRAALTVLGTLLVGLTWMFGVFYLVDLKLNFMNFIALPVSFGIGVDYAVNVVQRGRREGRGSALMVVKETGGAVVLCSLTTSLGYLALTRSTNFGVRSLGIAAFVGELCCLLAAVLILPAVAIWLRNRQAVELPIASSESISLVPSGSRGAQQLTATRRLKNTHGFSPPAARIERPVGAGDVSQKREPGS